MILSELLYPDEYVSKWSADDIQINEIVSDTRCLKPGCLFVCLRGTRIDTHQMMSYIFGCGAAAVLVEHGVGFERIPSLPIFEVPSTRKALAYAWSRYCRNPGASLKLIGITGTNGKSSTAELLYRALLAGGLSVGIIGTLSARIGETEIALPDPEKMKRLTTMTTPDPDILFPLLRMMADSGCEYVVMEVSSHALALDKVAPLHFTQAIFTNLSHEHLDFHRSMQAYGEAKARLFAQCDTAIINCDDAFGESLASKLSCEVIRCGILWDGDVTAKQIEYLGADGVSYLYRTEKFCFLQSLNLPGAFSVYNSLLAITSAVRTGVPPHIVSKALSSIRAVRGRMERISSPEDDITVILDYAHTPEAMRSLLLTMHDMCRENQRITVLFGCGGDRDKSKRAVMGKCACDLADFTYITSDNSRTEDPIAIIRDILTGHTEKKKRRVIVDRERAIREAVMDAANGDILLLVGKGHETYEVKKKEIIPFDERVIAQNALSERRRKRLSDVRTSSCG